MFQDTFGMLFSSDVECFPYLHLGLSFYYIIEMPWGQNRSVLVQIKLFLGTLDISNHRILMIEYCSTDKAYLQ